MLSEVETFLVERGGSWSESTCRTYGWCLRSLAKYLAEKELQIEDVSLGDLTDWLQSQSWGLSLGRLAIIAARHFFRWTLGESRSPAEEIRMPKSRTRPQRTLSREQATALLQSFDTSTVQGRRDLAIVSLMLDTGLRAAEVCRLRMDDIDLHNCDLVVQVKGGRFGRGVFGAYASLLVGHWVDDRARIVKAGVKEVFIGLGGTRPGTRLTPDGLRVIFRRIGRQAGIGLLSPHDLRRTFATLAIENGAPTRLVQLAGRWQSLSEVERYTRELTAAAFQQYSPVHSLMGLRVNPDRGAIL